MKVLITGASSGMGRDMARILRRKCKEMVLVGRNEERLLQIKEEVEKDSRCLVSIVATDLSVQENCIRLYQENKGVDLLINNAGFGDTGVFDQTSLLKDTEMIETNVIACHTLTKLYLKDMKKKNKGHILNVASIAGYLPGPLMVTYYATKNYVVKMSEGIREELRREKSNVRISILCPGPVDTNFSNAANVNFTFRGKNSYEVAKYALEHLHQFYIVPGVGMKVARIAARLLPASLVARIVYYMQKQKNQ